MLIDKQTPGHEPHMGMDLLAISYVTLGRRPPVDDGFCLRSVNRQRRGKYANDTKVKCACVLFGWIKQRFSMELCHNDSDSNKPMFTC